MSSARPSSTGGSDDDHNALLRSLEGEDGSEESVASNRQRLDRVVEGSYSIFLTVQP